MATFTLTVRIDDFDAERFTEELTTAVVEDEGIGIRTGGRRFDADVTAFGIAEG